MPAKDIYHEGFKNALIKEGWQIIRDPYTIRYEGLKLFADLKGKKLFSAQKEDTDIVVEIKSFLSLSLIHEFQCALGQYILYRTLLSQINPDCHLYLAIEQEVYETFFQQKGVKLVTEQYQILLIVINIYEEKVIKWIN
ncbi:XisH family protein [Aphanothece sacrum]|uniref:XisH protein n=1 Tax=Aphanothece sacrum FPU1 TaxID=1920663 RepID=A0A401IH01_APHSA|nr:XisH family protein [Aphanothece sacrum]GBF80486.1 XisH protein [Aphanothece sacrum FPU1]GBF86377.1 XisH protein [Aphanothece sacrum FPU3]